MESGEHCTYPGARPSGGRKGPSGPGTSQRVLTGAGRVCRREDASGAAAGTLWAGDAVQLERPGNTDFPLSTRAPIRDFQPSTLAIHMSRSCQPSISKLLPTSPLLQDLAHSRYPTPIISLRVLIDTTRRGRTIAPLDPRRKTPRQTPPHSPHSPPETRRKTHSSSAHTSTPQTPR